MTSLVDKLVPDDLWWAIVEPLLPPPPRPPYGGGLPLTAVVTAANVNDTLLFATPPQDVPAVRTPSGRRRKPAWLGRWPVRLVASRLYRQQDPK